MRPKTKDVKKTTLSLDERDRALLDALARLNHSSATALVEKWTREKAIEEGLLAPEMERERIIAEWKRNHSRPRGKASGSKLDLNAVQIALKRMPTPRSSSKTKR